MLTQTLVVACLVAACSAYAVWTLAPNGLRRAIARTLLRLPLPRRVAATMQRHAAAAAACGCDGCDRAPAAAKPATGGAAPITFHKRLPR